MRSSVDVSEHYLQINKILNYQIIYQFSTASHSNLTIYNLEVLCASVSKALLHATLFYIYIYMFMPWRSMCNVLSEMGGEELKLMFVAIPAWLKSIFIYEPGFFKTVSVCQHLLFTILIGIHILRVLPFYMIINLYDHMQRYTVKILFNRMTSAIIAITSFCHSVTLFFCFSSSFYADLLC